MAVMKMVTAMIFLRINTVMNAGPMAHRLITGYKATIAMNTSSAMSADVFSCATLVSNPLHLPRSLPI